MVDVIRDVYIPWDPDSKDITIRTDSETGSEENVGVQFYDDNNQDAGSVFFRFASPMKYQIGWCRSPIPFPVSPPTQTDKTWRIAYNPAELRVVIHCNEVEVLYVVLSDSVCNYNGGWRTCWEQRKPTQISFPPASNTASDEYCLGREPAVGMHK